MTEFLNEMPDSIKYMDVIESLTRQVTTLPRKWTPVSELSEREKMALAIAAGAPYRTWVEGSGREHHLRFETIVPIGIADRGDGGYIVAIGSMHK